MYAFSSNNKQFSQKTLCQYLEECPSFLHFLNHAFIQLLHFYQKVKDKVVGIKVQIIQLAILKFKITLYKPIENILAKLNEIVKSSCKSAIQQVYL